MAILCYYKYMAVNHEQTKTIETEQTVEFDLADHYLAIEAESTRRLDTPELDNLLEVAVADGILERKVYDQLQETKGDEHYKLKEEIFGNLNPRDLRKGFIERNQLDGTLASEEFQEASMEALEALGMTTPEKLPEGHYKLVVAHGGLNLTPWLRTKEALDTFINADGQRSADVVAVLGGDRKTSDAERKKAESYISDYSRDVNNEADLMDAAVEHWLREHNLEDVIEQSETIEGAAHGETVSGMPYGIRLYDLQAAKANGRLPSTMPDAIASLNAPMDPTRQIRRGIKTAYKNRPDTEDPLDMVRQVVDLQPGDLVGSISHHPVSKGQLLITQNVLFEDGVIVKEGAYKSDALINNPGVRFSEICKVVSGSEQLRQRAHVKLADIHTTLPPQ